MQSLTSMLGLAAGGAAAVVGCGGKTSLVEHLAAESEDKCVLISPTTKILCPNRMLHTVCTTPAAAAAHTPHVGRQYAGILNRSTGKLEALPPDVLHAVASRYHLVLMEADGSAGLPCKGWAAGEPVVPPFATHTVGVVTMTALGQCASVQNVLRLPQFTQLTGLQKGDTITMQALARMVAGPGGMFKNAVGRRFLFVNAVEHGGAAANAHRMIGHIVKHYPGVVQKYLYGSIRQKRWLLAWQ